MLDAIYHFFAVIFGYIMNFFYILLDFVGFPYLWLCIVLFAAGTRLLFVPQKIRTERKAVLAPAINFDLQQLRKSYGSVSKNDKERLAAYQKDTKAIFKKYKVSSGTGCLTALLQFPVLVGLFKVIKEPFLYVPRLSHLTEVEKVAVNDFFGLSLESLPLTFGALGIIVPICVLGCSLIQTLPSLLKKKVKPQPAVLILKILQPLLLTWMSFCFPIAISIYWVVNNLTNVVISWLIKKSLKNNKKIKTILDNTTVLIAAEKEEEALAKTEEVVMDNNSETLENVSAEDAGSIVVEFGVDVNTEAHNVKNEPLVE